MTIEINNVDVPVERVEEVLFCHSTWGVKTLTPRIYNRSVLDMYLETDFTYHERYYYNIHDANGNIIGEDNKFKVITKTEMYRCNDLDRLPSKRVVFYLNGDFRIINLIFGQMNRLEDVEEIGNILSTYCTAYTGNIYKSELMPLYEIYRGHSRACLGILNRSDIKMTYEELEQKKRLAIQMCIESEVNIRDKEYDEEWINEAFDHVVKAVCDYLFINENQYKKGTYNLIDKLNKRLNFNINKR